MSAPVSELHVLLATLSPQLHEGVWAFCCVPNLRDGIALEPVATVREAEGWTVIVAADRAEAAGLEVLYRAAWITLTVHSDLHAVGLTAAVATALAQVGLSCNVVAGAHHDHLFVPWEGADRAMATLRALAAPR